MTKAYERINWENDPSTDTPLNETNLNKMDLALDVIDDRVCGMEEDVQEKVDEAEAKSLVAEGWAKGTQNGVAVTSESPYYQNNAEYFKNQAEGTVTGVSSFNGRSGAVNPTAGDYDATQVMYAAGVTMKQKLDSIVPADEQYTKAEVDTLLNAKANNNDVTTALALKLDASKISIVTTDPGTGADSSGILLYFVVE